jgi:hypothetical protein
MFNKKNFFMKIKPFDATYINTYTSNGDPPFFLAEISQALGPGGQTNFCTSALPECSKTHSVKFDPELRFII